ncbi:MAG TPA: hypothetical protein VI977_02895 [archaeon]|nr:hypothetical protein [archaeon]
MPTKPLPRMAITRLQKAVRREQRIKGHLRDLYKFLGRLQNIDPRKELDIAKLVPENSTTGFARKVRQLNAKRTLGMPVVIKRTHEFEGKRKFTAKEVIEKIKQQVRAHNKRFRPKTYVLLEPIAYAILPELDLIAMARTENPSLGEVLGCFNMACLDKKTKRAKEFFAKLQEQHEVTREMLRTAADEVHKNTGIKYANLLIAGFSKGKFVFAALPDLE